MRYQIYKLNRATKEWARWSGRFANYAPACCAAKDAARLDGQSYVVKHIPTGVWVGP